VLAAIAGGAVATVAVLWSDGDWLGPESYAVTVTMPAGPFVGASAWSWMPRRRSILVVAGGRDGGPEPWRW
jgi:hypothetical protein